MPAVFISSTSVDLKDYRQAAIIACNELNLLPIAMEFFEAMGVGAVAASQRKLDEADVYVGIFAHRYGYVEDGYDQSVTEIEFDYAGERGLDRLCFPIDPDHPWPPKLVDKGKKAKKLDAFKKRVDKSLIRAMFTTPADFKDKLKSALHHWILRQQFRPGGLSGVLARTPDDVPEQPDQLIGRDDLAAEAHALLDAGKPVLLHGFGGAGKTALAAAIGAERIRAGKGPAVWLRAGNADPAALFEALARTFGAEREMAAAPNDDEKGNLARRLLADNGIRLLILDDCWHARALDRMRRALPPGVGLLATARRRYPHFEVIEVGKLARPAALDLLSLHAGRDLNADPDADRLCAKLADFAFSVRIAGIRLDMDDLAPGALLAQIEAAPYDLDLPPDFDEPGHRNLAALLQTSLDALPGDAPRAVFEAFGASFTPRATAEWLTLYLGQEREKVEDALLDLRRHGLAERLDADERNVESYRIHDLAHSYLRSRLGEPDFHRALDASLGYLDRYNEPSLPNFAALRPELDNLMGAATWAMAAGRYEDVEIFASDLYAGPGATGGLVELQGYYSRAVMLLSLAADAAHRRGERQYEGVYLGDLGNTYLYLHQVERAIEHFQQALAIHRAIGDRRNEGIWLGNLGIAYRHLSQTERAIEYHEQALDISREIGDRRGESADLGNLGLAYADLGQTERAIEHHQQALDISREIGDRRGEGQDLGHLGISYADLGQTERAIEHFQQALTIRREIGDRHGEGQDLGNLGVAYEYLKQYGQALDYFQRARDIYQELGLPHEVEFVDRNIADVERAQAEDKNSG